MSGLPAVLSVALPDALRAELAATAHFLEHNRSSATQRAYRSDWRIFEAWCADRGTQALPAEAATVAVFLASEASNGRRPATLGRRLAAIRAAHRAAGHEPPTGAELVQATHRGIRRTIGVAQTKKAPATADQVLAMVGQCPSTLRGQRDCALLLLGFAGAFRRSELAGLRLEDLESVSEGLRIHLRRSKTDQEGAGRVVPIPRGRLACPVAAVRAWIDAAGLVTGPVFRRLGKGGRVLTTGLSPYSVGRVVKQYAEAVGLDPRAYGGHSLRAGFLTSAALGGANLFRLMDQSGHRSVQTLRGYVRRAEEFRQHPGADLL